jgi:hypothetical protein
VESTNSDSNATCDEFDTHVNCTVPESVAPLLGPVIWTAGVGLGVAVGVAVAVGVGEGVALAIGVGVGVLLVPLLTVTPAVAWPTVPLALL